jgi:hypothetical protein
MSVSQADFFSRSGAVDLASRIRKYWLQRGYLVDPTIERCDQTPRGTTRETPYFVVRSTMVNGMPRTSGR